MFSLRWQSPSAAPLRHGLRRTGRGVRPRRDARAARCPVRTVDSRPRGGCRTVDPGDPADGFDRPGPHADGVVFRQGSMETVIPLFEQRHPGVKVDFVEQPFGDMSKKYLAALAAEQGVPDVIGLDTSMVGPVPRRGRGPARPAVLAPAQLKPDFVPGNSTPRGRPRAR